MKGIIFTLLLVVSALMSGCDYSSSDSNSTYNTKGDLNIEDNFTNLEDSDIIFDGKVMEMQYTIDSVPEDYKSNINDVNDDFEINECFEYTLTGFNISVDSVEHFTSDDTVITLKIYAILNNNNYLVYETILNGIAFAEFKLDEMFDTDVNDFLYVVEVEYQGSLINTIRSTIDVNGMGIGRDWNDYNE